MRLLLQKLYSNANDPHHSRIPQKLAKQILVKQEREESMNSARRLQWTESDLDELPELEPDFFERKAGMLYGQSHFKREMAATLSALANSGGGHLILGVKDNGEPDGLPEFHGGERMTVWLEKTIPNLLSYTLQSFRVHQVIPNSNFGFASKDIRRCRAIRGLSTCRWS